MDQQVQTELLQVLQPLLDQSILPAAADQPSQPADIICPNCQRLYTWRAMCLDQAGARLVCRECAASGRLAASVRKPLAVLKMPGFYVLLTVLLAGFLWMLGFGNPGKEELIKQDQGYPWNQQRYGKFLLQQGKRCKERSRALLKRQRRTEAAHWAALARKSFRELTEYWQGTDVEMDLRVAAALMLAARGEPDKGYKELAALAPHFPAKHPSHKAYRVHCGRLALESGRRRQGKQILERIMKSITDIELDLGSGMDTIFYMAEGMGKGQADFVMREQVRYITDLKISDDVLLEGCLKLLATHKVPSKLAAKNEQDLGRAVSVPEDPDPDTTGTLVIEDVEE